MKYIIVIALAFLSFSAQAKNFGDEVVDCAMRAGIQLDSPNKDKIFEACEKLVQQKRDTEENKKIVNRVVSEAILKACLNNTIISLDDAVSPASDIAKASVRYCNPEWQNFIKAFELPYSSNEEYADNILIDTATAIVLSNRRLTSNKARHQAAH